VPNKLTRGSLALVLLALAGVGAASAGSGAVTVKAAANNTLSATIITNSAGLTLYRYMDEKRGSIDCTGACKALWPPLLVAGSAKPVAGAGLVASKLSTIKRPDGGVQVTYNGCALYRYGADKKAGQVKGQGVRGSWFAVTPAGGVTKAVAATSSSTSSGSAPTTTPSAGTTAPPYNY